MRKRKATCVAALFVAGMLGSAHAADRALERPLTAAWEVDPKATASCIEFPEFVRLVEQRSARGATLQRQGAGQEKLPDVAVRVTSLDGGRVRADLDLQLADQPRMLRTLEGSCEEALSALSFVVALMIDRSRGADDAPGDPPVATAAPGAPAALPPEPRPRPAEPTVSTTTHFSLAGDVGGTYVAEAGLGFRLGGSLALWRATNASKTLSWSPGVRLGASRTFPLSVATALGTGSVSFFQAEADGMFLRVAVGSRVELYPILSTTIGAAFAGAGTVPGAHDSVRPRLALGPALRARFVLSKAFALVAAAGLHFPIVQDRFYFEPNTTLIDAPSVVPFFTMSPEWSIF